MIREFTATVFILEDERVLLIWHEKIGRWMPPGGHLEKGETPADGARREVLEETGLEVELVCQSNFSIEHEAIQPIPLPYMMQVERALADPNHPHQHVDFIYLGRLSGGTQKDGQWFTPDEIEKLCNKKEILPDVQKIALHMLSSIYGASD